MTVQNALRKVVGGENLSVEEAQGVMSQLMLGEVHHGLMGGFLAAMQCKGATGDELAGFAQVMRSHALTVDLGAETLVDTCGTGGGRATFNLSTGAALVAAAAGAKVAKHGNRAVTSVCGSADVLEESGISIEHSPQQSRMIFEQHGIVFLYAPVHHPAVRHVAPVRRELGIRTFFNLLGPLVNPAGATRQVVGVFDVKAMRPVAEAMVALGVEHGYVVHGEEGFDEVSPVGPTTYLRVRSGEISEGRWTPVDFGVSAISPHDLDPGKNVQENAVILRKSLEGDNNRSECLVPNAAVTLLAAGVVSDVQEGADAARQALRSGAALKLLDNLSGRSA